MAEKVLNIKVYSPLKLHHGLTGKCHALYHYLYNLLLEKLFRNLFDDGMFDYHKHIGDDKTKEEIIEKCHDPNHVALNRLEFVEEQCSWLREIGFKHVDCYLKIFELALFGGVNNNYYKY